MLGFLLGSAAIALPQHQIPLLGGYLGVKLISALKRGRQQDDDSRERPTAVGLVWDKLSLEINKKDGSVLKVLDGVSGGAYKGRLLAIMGPSGAGKTSLLNALARQVPYSSRASLHGELLIDGEPAQSVGRLSQAYVQQDDLFYSMLTVRETLRMATNLRLSKDVSDKDKDDFVEYLINKLGLSQCADTAVGDAKTRGLSGGEKKRLSIGCELIASPAVLFVDEPTSGLDSFQALRVVETLKKLAEEGRTVVCSIHQPRSSVFNLFDDLILLSGGKTVYCGAAEKALEYFKGQGHDCPVNYNPADFMADLISIDTSTIEQEESSKKRVGDLLSAWEKTERDKYCVKTSKLNGSAEHKLALSTSVSPWRQFRLLFKRSWLQTMRDKATNKARLGVNLNSALMFGLIFFRMKLTSRTVQDRLGLLQVVAVNVAMSSVTKMLNVFPPERTIVTRERAKNSYGVFPYFLAKILAEVPIGALFPAVFGLVVYPMCGLNPDPRRFAKFMAILALDAFAASGIGLSVGGLASSTNVAVAVGPAVMILFIVFGGLYINPDNTPRALRFLPNASLIRWTYEGLVLNEFKGAEFEEEDGSSNSAMKNGEDVLKWLKLDGVALKRAIAANGRIILLNYWLTYNILRAKKPRFVELQPPKQQ